jgi:hypothetical protein
MGCSHSTPADGAFNDLELSSRRRTSSRSRHAVSNPLQHPESSRAVEHMTRRRATPHAHGTRERRLPYPHGKASTGAPAPYRSDKVLAAVDDPFDALLPSAAVAIVPTREFDTSRTPQAEVALDTTHSFITVNSLSESTGVTSHLVNSQSSLGRAPGSNSNSNSQAAVSLATPSEAVRGRRRVPAEASR